MPTALPDGFDAWERSNCDRVPRSTHRNDVVLDLVDDMKQVAGLDRNVMVKAAAARRLVVTRSGRVGRLVRWDAPKSRNRARIITHAETGFVVKCEDVLEVDLETD